MTLVRRQDTRTVWKVRPNKKNIPHAGFKKPIYKKANPLFFPATLNKASDYRTNGLYWTVG